MTANELADALHEVDAISGYAIIGEAQTMLRQQAQEIKNCNMDIDALKTFNNDLEQEIKALHKLVKEQDLKIINLAFDLEYAKRTDEFVKKENEDRDSALYATGYWNGITKVKPRELTDEEINKLWAESHEDGIAMQQGFTTQQHYFAHLILKKAGEK